MSLSKTEVVYNFDSICLKCTTVSSVPEEYKNQCVLFAGKVGVRGGFIRLCGDKIIIPKEYVFQNKCEIEGFHELLIGGYNLVTHGSYDGEYPDIKWGVYYVNNEFIPIELTYDNDNYVMVRLDNRRIVNANIKLSDIHMQLEEDGEVKIVPLSYLYNLFTFSENIELFGDIKILNIEFKKMFHDIVINGWKKLKGTSRRGIEITINDIEPFNSSLIACFVTDGSTLFLKSGFDNKLRNIVLDEFDPVLVKYLIDEVLIGKQFPEFNIVFSDDNIEKDWICQIKAIGQYLHIPFLEEYASEITKLDSYKELLE